MINCSFGWEKDIKGPESGDKYGLLGYKPLAGTLAGTLYERAKRASDRSSGSAIPPPSYIALPGILFNPFLPILDYPFVFPNHIYPPLSAYGRRTSVSLAVASSPEYILVPKKQIKLVPDWMTDAEAAAIPLAALTAFRALFTKGGLPKSVPSDAPKPRVLVCGIGGGVALFALQYAVAAGADVYVTSSSDEKIARAVELGAKGGANYRKSTWTTDLLSTISSVDATRTPGIEIIIDGAGFDVDGMISVVSAGGVIVTYGATAGAKQSVSITPHFIKQVEWKGTAMGSDVEWDVGVESREWGQRARATTGFGRVARGDMMG